ncbi:MAG: response regulator transcription factor [Candidatus Ozemobacteraceae bacterium]
MKVLIAEDDQLTRNGLEEILRNEGYSVIAASNGVDALALFTRASPDFVCLDVMMPGKDGYSVCREIRSLDSHIPIIFISAKSEEIDKVVGLEIGADDFIVKPFGVREVVSRIRAITRRCMHASFSVTPASDTSDAVGEPKICLQPFSFGDLRVVPQELRARKGEEVIDLSLRETRLLALFSRNPGKVLTRQDISEACWDADHFPTSRTLDQHISQLRKRIEADSRAPKLIKTVYGSGYRYDPDES